MDLDALRMFAKVAELSSFTRAGVLLGVPKARVSLRITALEAELGTKLFQRTTRAVHLTPDGETLLPRAQLLVDEAADVATMFQVTSTLRGRVRLDLPIAFGRNLVIPKLPDFLAQHPLLELLVSTTDRRVDVVREGFDLVLRIGTLREPGLIAKRLGALPMTNVASPAYLRRYGLPRRLADLDHHRLVHYSSQLGAEPPVFEYQRRGRWVTRPMQSTITVNGTDAYRAAALAGLGIAQIPRVGVTEAIAAGELVELLPEHTSEPLPVSLVHAHGRSPPRPVRVVMTFVAEAMASAFVVA